MKRARFGSVVRRGLGNIFREVKVALAPLLRLKIIFVGCFNSGTTLIFIFLARHPDDDLNAESICRSTPNQVNIINKFDGKTFI